MSESLKSEHTLKREPWSHCETPKEKCTMNYCDDNGCLNRVRNYVNNEVSQDDLKISEERAIAKKQFYVQSLEILKTFGPKEQSDLLHELRIGLIAFYQNQHDEIKKAAQDVAVKIEILNQNT